MPLTSLKDGKLFPACTPPSLLQDIELYRRLSLQLPLPPSGFMLPHLDVSGAADLCDRYTVNAATWWAFRDAVAATYPDIPRHTSTVAADGTVLDSVPERIVYERLKPKLGPNVVLILHPPLPIVGRGFVSDFGLVPQSGRMFFVEVAGSVGSDFKPLTKVGKECINAVEKKLGVCKSAGITRLVVIYADEVCRMDRLDAAIDRVLLELAEGEAS